MPPQKVWGNQVRKQQRQTERQQGRQPVRQTLSISFCLSSLHFTGKSPRKWTRAQAPPSPILVEEALWSSEVGDFPPHVRFGPRPGLIPALTKAQPLAPHQSHSPCRNNGWTRWFPRLFKMKQQLKHETYRSQGQTGSPAGQQP